ncbi:MAG: hypothetical protein ACI4OT_06355 [Bacilli bacterium]
MKEKIKSFNLIQIISNILLLIAVVGVFITKQDIKNVLIGLYWFAITLNIVGMTWFLATWTKGGVNADVHRSKRILQELDNITLTFVVCYVLSYLGIVFLQSINPIFRDNIYLIIGFYLFTLVAELILFIAEEKAYKETLKVIKKNKIGKNDRNDR